MLTLSTAPYWTASLLVLSIPYILYRKRRNKSLPPGPRKYPIIGNVLTLPPRLNSQFFEEMGKKYDSDIIHFEGLGQSIFVLNSYEAAKELLDRRSGIYSSRPYSVMIHELSGQDYLLSMLAYNDEWRAARKLFTRHFRSPESHLPREVTYVHRFLKNLLHYPQDWYAHVKHLPGGATIDMTYGIDVTSRNEPLVQLVDEGARAHSDLVADGSYLVDLIPILKYLPEWFPGAGFQKIAAHSRIVSKKLVDTPYSVSNEMVKIGNFTPSFVTSHIAELGSIEPGEEMLKRVAGTAYVGGSDTTASALGTFFLAMTLYPEVQRKAQKELDSVLQGRLPEHGDLPSLPYISALVLEVLRWKPVTPIGAPHVNTMDDVYRGYYIPSGSTIIANQNTMLHNEADFPEPYIFNPGRFLKDGQLDPSVRDPTDIAFGFGRRICPGSHIGKSLLFLAASSVLSAFNISKKVNAAGEEIEPNVLYTDSAMTHPLEFPCAIKPRSSQAAELVDLL